MLNDLANYVQRRGGHRLGLVVFAARAHVACPLTHDYDHFRHTLTTLDPADPLLDIGPRADGSASGTRLGAGLRKAVQLLDDRFRGYQDIVLLSDGDDPGDDHEWRDGIAAANEHHIPVYVVGIGDPNIDSPVPDERGGRVIYQDEPIITRLKEEPLEDIARHTGGAYLPARTAAFPLGDFFRKNIEPRPAREIGEDVLPVYRQYASWFFGAALLCLAIEMALSDRRVYDLRRAFPGPHRNARNATGDRSVRHAGAAATLAIVALCQLSAAPADDAARQVESGNAAFLRGDFSAAVDHYTRAEERTKDPGLVAFNKATALYRLGQYRDAEVHYLRCVETAAAERRMRALYNAANAIVQQTGVSDAKRLETAIGYYENALRLGPAGEFADDVQSNLELAQTLLAKARIAEDQPPRNDPRDSSAKPPPEHTPNKQDMMRADNADGPQHRVGKNTAKASRNDAAIDQLPLPGAGNLPVLPDQGEPVRLSNEDTTKYLEEMEARVRQERTEHRRRSMRAPDPRVRDW
jgi:tetratricopeptide (TPR) repeat protein